jgi:hypothetical protein
MLPTPGNWNRAQVNFLLAELSVGLTFAAQQSGEIRGKMKLLKQRLEDLGETF